MSGIAEFIPGSAPILAIADHASNHVPPGIELEIPDALLNDHIAIDIGAGPLSRALAERLGCPAILAKVSRLVVDLNRDDDAANLIPAISDGYVIPGNAALEEEDRAERIARFWSPYHALIDTKIRELRPRMLLSIHSFTPQLASDPSKARPWEVGILYNEDDRAARRAIPLLIASGIVTGDNEPYSGVHLNATMNRHAESRGMPYLGIEVRQDLISDPAGVSRWADRLAPVVADVTAALA
jgi:predicted N-formylglutamate amidohydrolase